MTTTSNDTTPNLIGRRAMLTALGLGGLASVGSIYSKIVLSDRASAQARASIAEFTRNVWGSTSETVAFDGIAVDRPIGSTLGFLYIPRLRDQVWGFPIVEGTNPKQLKVGVGHLRQTALPGIDGNVALFGHRTSYGRPFDRFDQLEVGDQVVIETIDRWFVYSLAASQKVDPSAVWVAKPNPFMNGNVKGPLPFWKNEQKKLVTLITCTPKYSTAMRWVWWGTQTAQSPADSPPSIVMETSG